SAKFTLHDVEIEGPVTPIGAALTIPSGEGPFPAVLFLSGSGTHDRHGIAGEIDIGTHEVMDYIAECGFAGLRYDTRGAGTTRHGRDVLDLGLRALADDAYACFELLERHPAVDPRNLFLVGHSQGGTLALFLTAKYGVEPRGIVLMAASGRPIDEVMFDQLASQGPLIGLSPEQVAAQRKELETFIDLARKDGPVELDAVPDHLRGLVRSRSWLREHLLNPPADLLRSVHCSLLIAQAGKDFQVSPERDAEQLFSSAREAGIDVELARFPTLDHLFKPTEGESRMAQYYDRSRHVSREFLHHMEAWLSKVKRLP
ncbi:MAG TPA: alpha/beta fold hydrolase, partial [Edaphobacter sp.]|nr:alpha/beta fold hydrolase [Edaphobacter sp.]